MAANYLGRFYSLGRGVEQDDTHARELFEKAAAAGNGDAMDNLAVCTRTERVSLRITSKRAIGTRRAPRREMPLR